MKHRIMTYTELYQEFALLDTVKHREKQTISYYPQLTPREEAELRLQALRDWGWQGIPDIDGAERRIAAARMRKAMGVK